MASADTMQQADASAAGETEALQERRVDERPSRGGKICNRAVEAHDRALLSGIERIDPNGGG